jgi:phenylpropionate dioxygenase-like ring-hydroxylating dioxygenase large terminal subunit
VDSVAERVEADPTSRSPAARWEAFANPSVVVESWYVAARSARLRRGQVRSTEQFGRRLAVYRDLAGTLHAVDGTCAHLGADLGQARVVGDQLTCAFHGWRFAAGGECLDAPRHLQVYPVMERWGYVFVYAGKQPAFDLPKPRPGWRHWTWRIPPQRMACHPHLVIANGLDAAHVGPLHGLELTAPPRLTRSGDHRLSVPLRLRPASPAIRLLTGGELLASFTTIGATLAWIEVECPVHFDVLFSAAPSAAGGCLMHAVVFTPPSPIDVMRALLLTMLITRDDRRILEGLRFHPGLTNADEGLRAFADLVDRLEVFK